MKRATLQNSTYTNILIACILLLGALLRFLWLGQAAMRADSMVFWNGGIPGACPLAVETTKRFVEFFNLEDFFFWRRFPSAVWGVLAIPVAYWLGLGFSSRRTGLILCLLTAIHPFLLQISREAYFYAPLTLGAFLASVFTVNHLKLSYNQPIRPGSHCINALALVLLLYVHVPGWPFAFLYVSFNVGISIIRIVKRKRLLPSDSVFPFVCLVVGLPTLAAPWGPLEMIKRAFDPTNREVALQIWDHSGTTLEMIFRAVSGMGWGSSPLRLTFTAAVILIGLYGLFVQDKPRVAKKCLPIALLVAALVQLFSRKVSVSPYEARYLLPAFPLYLLLLTVGLETATDWFKQFDKRPSGVLKFLPVTASVLLFASPVWSVLKLPGNPTAYREIVAWADTTLPSGSLVLVDRWFEPWNELKVHPSTNVIFTFTVPNEPPPVYIQSNWRQTAKDFLARYPGAAYLEISKSYWDLPEIGPWNWPETYFANKKVFVNKPGLALRKSGLASRSDFYSATTNRLVVDFFYNTIEDLQAKARAYNEPGFVLFASDWGYTKTQDYRDWRILKEQAVLDLYNVQSTDIFAVVNLTGVAVNGVKRVRISPQLQHTFNNQQFDQWTIGPVKLPPGKTSLVLSDTLGDSAKAALLVDRVRLQAVDDANNEAASLTLD